MWVKEINISRKKAVSWMCHLCLNVVLATPSPDAPACKDAASCQFAQNPTSLLSVMPIWKDNSYFYSVTHKFPLQTASPHHPPSIPHQEASTLNMAPCRLPQCWEVCMGIITNLRLTPLTCCKIPFIYSTRTKKGSPNLHFRSS